jgi:hypothetical protein
MSTVEEAYIKYKAKVEKNITNDDISTDRGRFVLVFNEAQNKFTEIHLQNRGSDDIRYIEHLLTPDKKISENKSKYDRQDFPQPKDYFDLSNLRVFASKGKCKNEEIKFLYEPPRENLQELLHDENNKPSFKWREAIFNINSNNISIYNDKDFKVDYILLSYYRYPNQISLIDSDNPESKFRETKIEWDDKSLDRIISLSAGETDMNDLNPRYQLQQTRTLK